jgi:acyl-CoA thioesterase
VGLRTTRAGEPIATANPWRRLWAPERLAWWVAVIFIIGSAFFVVGAAGSLMPSVFGGKDRMSVFAEANYFAGATLYTAGIYCQLLEGLNADERIGPNRESHPPKRFRWFVSHWADLGRLEILIPLVFLIGSLVFNYETTDSLGSALGLMPRLALWETSLLGSVFFLLAGLLIFIEAGHRYLSFAVRDISWWIAVLFTIGGIGFVIGCLPGLHTPGLPTAKEGSGPAIVKVGFLTGGVAYLVGSYLMLPELFTELRRHRPDPARPPRRNHMPGTLHPFDRAIQLDAVAGALRGETRPEWANMVGPFGGITAAILLHAAESDPDRIGDPLALTVNFAGPVADGEFDIGARAARTNRSNQHWVVELSQADEVKTTATAVFGMHRDTWADTETLPPSAAPPEHITPGGLREDIAWAKRYDMRFAEGDLPTTGEPSPSSTTTLWVRDADGRPIDFPALAAVCDVFYPRVFLRRGGFIPSSTISLTTYFHADQQQLDAVGGDFVLCSAHANRFSRGYFDQSAHLWSREGQLLASTHQLVYFKG